MPANTYIGVNGVARHVKNIWVGVNGVARKVKNGWIGVNGVARRFYMSEFAPQVHGYILFYAKNSSWQNTFFLGSCNPIALIRSNISGIGFSDGIKICGSTKYYYTSNWAYNPETLAYVKAGPGGNVCCNGTWFMQAYTRAYSGSRTEIDFRILNEDTYAVVGGYEGAIYQSEYKTFYGSGTTGHRTTTNGYTNYDEDDGYGFSILELDLVAQSLVRQLDHGYGIHAGGNIYYNQYDSYGSTYLTLVGTGGVSIRNYSSNAQVGFISTGWSSGGTVVFFGNTYWTGGVIKKPS